MIRFSVLLGLPFLLLVTLSGCPNKPPGSASQSASKNDWENFILPKYAARPFDESDETLRAEAEDDQLDIQKLLSQAKQKQAEANFLFPHGDAIKKESLQRPDYKSFWSAPQERYLKETSDPSEVQDAAAELLQDFFEFEILRDSTKTTAELIEAGEDVIHKGSTDPLVNQTLANLYWNADQKEKAQEIYLKIVLDKERRSLGAIGEAIFRAQHYKLSKDANDIRGATNARAYAMIDAFVELFSIYDKEANIRPALSLAIRSFSRLDIGHKEDFVVALIQADGVPPYILHFFAGQYLYDRGWNDRGSGFANTVNQEGWSKYKTRLTAARKHLLKAWQIDPSIPDAPARLISLAAEGYDPDWTARDWFLQTIYTELDYEKAYQSFFWTMTPRWGGSHQHLVSFIQECVDTKAWDTIVPNLGFRFLVHIQNELGASSKVGQIRGAGDIAASYIKNYREAVAKEEKFKDDRPWHLLMCAVILKDAQRYDEAKDIIEEFGDRISVAAYEHLREKKTYLVGELDAMTGEAKEKVKEWKDNFADLESSAEIELVHELSELLQEIRNLEQSEHAQLFFDDLAEMLAQYNAFYNNEWVNLTFTENLPGWYIRAANHKIVDESTIELHSSQAYLGTQISLLNRFPAPYLVEATIEILPESQAKSTDLPGIILGTPDFNYTYQEHFLNLTANDEIVVVTNTSYGREPEYQRGFEIPSDQPARRLQIKVWQDRIEIVTNRRRVTSESRFELIPAGMISFGELLYEKLPQSVRFSDLRIHKLLPQPAEDSPQEVRAAYWKNHLEIDDSVMSLILAGMSYKADGDYDEAIRLYKEAMPLLQDPGNLYAVIASTLNAMQRYEESTDGLEEALRKDAENHLLQNALAWNLAAIPDPKFRNATRAIQLARKACEHTNYLNGAYLDTLACAYAENGEFDQAIKYGMQALDNSAPALHETIQTHIDLFEENKPYHFSPDAN